MITACASGSCCGCGHGGGARPGGPCRRPLAWRCRTCGTACCGQTAGHCTSGSASRQAGGVGCCLRPLRGAGGHGRQRSRRLPHHLRPPAWAWRSAGTLGSARTRGRRIWGRASPPASCSAGWGACPRRSGPGRLIPPRPVRSGPGQSHPCRRRPAERSCSEGTCHSPRTSRTCLGTCHRHHRRRMPLRTADRRRCILRGLFRSQAPWGSLGSLGTAQSCPPCLPCRTSLWLPPLPAHPHPPASWRPWPHCSGRCQASLEVWPPAACPCL
mmetsp:Transcript_69734/g.168719  ORF Transcript_69734/g.168719 Transcript_69734/m.168719 type:complete len:270 (+) Transcript_69734:84-893(+)